MSDFLPFQKLLPKALQTYKVSRSARAAMICERFRKIVPGIVGEESEDDVRPKYFKGHTLYISVSSSGWAQRVYVNRHDLIMKLNLDMDKDYVHEIRTLVEVNPVQDEPLR